MSTLLKIDKEYKEWIADISNRFRKSQIKAAVKVNSEMLQFYWSIGRDISQMELVAKYGSGFYQKLSFDLKNIFPGSSSFSETNLRYMWRFYELYPQINNLPQVVAKPENENLPQVVANSNDVIMPQVVAKPQSHLN